MLFLWWDFKGVLYYEYELLPAGKTVVLIVYRLQLNKLSNALFQKQPELVSGKGVVTPHVINHLAKMVEFWHVLLHPPYSRGLGPSDYILLCSLQNSLNRKTFGYKKVMKTHLDKLFANKLQIFYERRIMEMGKDGKKSLITTVNI